MTTSTVTGAPTRPGLLPHREWALWSTRVRVVVTDPAALDLAVTLVGAELEMVQDAVSRFHAGSELLALNAAARRRVWSTTGDPAVAGTVQHRLAPVSDTFATLLGTALTAARRTEGAVDPTVGGSLRALGYDRDIALVRAAGVRVDADAVPAAGWQRVGLRRHAGRWWVSLPADAELDLGATAKAAAADRAAERVARELGCGVLVSLGGDLATAGPSPADGWQVDVADREGDPACRVALHGRTGLATSSTRRRTWHRRGRAVHHVVDPATGLSADSPWGAVSVVATTCVEANAATTATIVAGDRGLTWLQSTGLPARLVGTDGGTDVRLGAWPAEAAGPRRDGDR